MLKHNLQVWAVWCVLALWSAVAWAGMSLLAPDESTRRLILSDAGRMRYEAISFFLVVLLLAALVVRRLWNRLKSDFPKLPRMTYGRALGVVVLWGLLFLVVLTMIAGTREMMTPGVWEKQGLLYRIPTGQPAATASPSPVEPSEPQQQLAAAESPHPSPEGPRP
jgi:hypothetical protein